MSSNKPGPGSPAQVVMGIIVMLIGLLFLLDNLGLMDFDFAFHFWPTLLIVFGCVRVTQTRHPAGYIVGAAMILAGVLMTLKALGLFYFSYKAFWPLVIIAVGVSVVYRSVTGRRLLDRTRLRDHFSMPDRGTEAGQDVGQKTGPGAPVSLAKGAPDEDSIIDATAILAGYKRRISTSDFRGGEITAIMGGCELDLRQTGLRGDAVLNVFAMWGGITIRVPPEWTVVLQGTPLMGGFEEKTAVPPDASKRLFVRGYVVMGGLEVSN